MNKRLDGKFEIRENKKVVIKKDHVEALLSPQQREEFASILQARVFDIYHNDIRITDVLLPVCELGISESIIIYNNVLSQVTAALDVPDIDIFEEMKIDSETNKPVQDG